jgi:hypothetical protein
VVADSDYAGLDGRHAALQALRPQPTIVRGVMYLPANGEGRPARGELLNISGRKVLDLHPGANDVRALAPGVYFVREEPQAASLKPPAIRKVVLTR